MTAAHPSIRVTRRLPAKVEGVLAERLGARLNPDDAPLDRYELADAMRNADILVPTITDRIDAELLKAPGNRVRLIANYGAGVDHIDLVAARAAGIAVTNTPDALTEATAELAILLMLMAARRAGEGEREVRAGAWTGWRPTHLIGNGLHGRVLALVGFGRIAQATAAKARGLGMTIRYVSRSPVDPAVRARLAAEPADTLVDLVRDADVVSLHTPGGAATRHMIDRNLLRAMQPHAVLVNTARGSVIDEAALVEALDAGWIGAAALDVYAEEPAVHPGLLAHPRSVLLPHLGSATIEARVAMGMQAIANIDAFLSGKALPNHVA
ncbi:D-glycerate dehydrogenase [Brevundimonas sp. SORGH_AS_0993]|uniref:2-hydroxyacid dehydrogenase n=1 Tax=Brevundimonas sp. SORGH_AS_0993 TaxID=3041794 RepID=UPI002786AE08|nr:D-glycerate dehydrogenase [Brevundimonas sp. SORGH_AS_0993]MDQ1155155.1 lactate dehydrogenase-like 2-hydroxyacid dehydrogenase [Brevundimonas sp. SORGH_AS_0993]